MLNIGPSSEQVRPLSEDEQARLKKAETVAKPLPGNPPKGFQQRTAHLGMRIAKWVLNSAVNRYLPLFTAPLLAIPVVGWILWLSLNGAAAGAPDASGRITRLDCLLPDSPLDGVHLLC